MAFYAQMMLRIAIELAPRDPAYDQMAAKFAEHVLWIVAAMDRVGEHNDELWDEQDGFFYDVLRFPNGQATRLKVRSMVGLLAICASIVVDQDTLRVRAERWSRALNGCVNIAPNWRAMSQR